MTQDTTKDMSKNHYPDANSPDKQEYAPSEALESLSPVTQQPLENRAWPLGWRPYATLLGSFLLMFNSWGIVNAYGTFASVYSETLFKGDDILLTNLIGSTQSFVVLALSFAVGRLLDADYSRQLTLCGAIIITIGMFMLSVCNGDGGVNQGNFGLTWLTQGLITGLGMACFFVTSSQVTATWFHEKKGFAIGIVASGASISGLVLPIMLRYLIASEGFNNAVRYVTTVIAITSFAAVLLATPNPVHQFRKPEKWLSRRTWIDTSAFREPSFCWFTASVAALFLGFYCVFFNLEEWAAVEKIAYKGKPPPGVTRGLETYWLLSIMNACSTVGRLSSAWLCDHFGALNVHMTVTFVSSLLCLILWTLSHTLAPALVFAILFGMFSGSVIGLPPASVAAILGKEPHRQAKLGQWTGMMYTAAAPFALVGPVIAGHIVSKYQTYLGVQIWSGMCLFLSSLCMGVAVYYNRRQEKSMSDEERV